MLAQQRDGAVLEGEGEVVRGLPAGLREPVSERVERDVDGTVRFRIEVFSRPHELIARVGAPVARVLQRRATERYLAAMRDLG